MNNPKIDKSGTKCWYNDDYQLHRENEPAIEWKDGSKHWYINGELHRVDGPAVELSDGEKWWCINGRLHREDGPAMEWDNGYKEWWYNGEFIGRSHGGFTQEDFKRYLKIKEYW